MCALRKGSHEADFAAGHYVQRQRVVYHRLLGQDETGRQRYVRQAGGSRCRQGENPGLIGRHKHEPGLELGACSSLTGRDTQRPRVDQHEHVRRRGSELPVVRFIYK